MKFIGKRKTGFIASALALVFFVAIGVGASFAWFDDSATSSTISPTSLQTNGLKTDALVYSGNARHTNDDATAQAPVGDEGGTYGYDHAQTGNATSYYLMLDRDGNGSVSLTSGDSLQMFTNIYNSDDEACYFKLSLKAGDYFKIYNSDLAGNLAESWYGYDRIQETNPTSFAKAFGTWPFEDDGSGSHNIKVKSDAATQVYDIYFDEYSGIWIDLHIDETRSKATSALTGYYIVGDSSSSDSGTFLPAWTTTGGYAMYIDEDNTNNKGIYLGLYLRPNDLFKITTKADSGGEWYGFNDVRDSCGAYSCFADDGSGNHNIKCLTTGYYNIFLTEDAKPVSIEKYGGSYSVGGGSHTTKGAKRPTATGPLAKGPTRKMLAGEGKKCVFYHGTHNMIHAWNGPTVYTDWNNTYLSYDAKGHTAGKYYDYSGKTIANVIFHTSGGSQTADLPFHEATPFWHDTQQEYTASQIGEFLSFRSSDNWNTPHYFTWNSSDYTFTYNAGFLTAGTQFKFAGGIYRTDWDCEGDIEGADKVTVEGNTNYRVTNSGTFTFTISAFAYWTYGNFTHEMGSTYTQEPHWTVSYDANGGTYEGSNDVYVGSGAAGTTTASYTPDYTNISRTGYDFAGWRYNNNTYTSGSIALTGGTTSGVIASLVAQWTESTYRYYFVSSGNGWATTQGGSNEKTVGSQSSPTSWAGVVSDGTLEFKIFRRNCGADAEWNFSCLDNASKTYCSGNGSSNITISTAGTYSVTLDIGGTITVAPMQYKLDQYASEGGASAAGFPITQTLDASGNVVFDDVVLTIGNHWHIGSLATTDDCWGWNTNLVDHIQATPNYASYFSDSGTKHGQYSNIHSIVNRYTMTVDITFNKAANTIVVSDIRLGGTFSLKQSNTVDGTSYPSTTGTPSIDGTRVTISNAVLLTGYNYYLDVAGGAGFGWDKFYVASAYPTMTHSTGNLPISDPSGYFYSSNNNIGVKFGGQYDLVFDISTQKCSSVHLDSLTYDDFKVNLDGVDGGFATPASGQSTSFVWTKTDLNMSIGSVLYINSALSKKQFKVDAGLSVDYSTYGSYFTTSSGAIKSLVDCTISFTFTFNPSTNSGTLAITSFTFNPATITPYANSDLESGMYFVSGADDYACDGANASRMFYGTAENVNCVYAYSGLVVSSTSTLYQLKEAYSSSVTTLKEHIPSQILLNFSNDGTSPGQSKGRDVGNFVQFTRTGTFDVLIYHEEISSVMTWTIEVKLTGKTVDTSSEHESKWSLIGRGTAPASALYDGDFTTNRGLPMWCAQGVEDPYPCYAGSIGGIGDTTNGKGGTITLLEGDQLALNGSNGLLTPTINATYGTVSSNVVTMKRSGSYYVYAANTSGFTIEFASEYDGRSNTDRSIEASENPSQYGAPISYTKMDGARVKRASGNSLSFASGINASLMDATSDGMIKVFVELRHINQTGRSGNLTATLSSVAAPTGTKYTVNTYNNTATPVQSALDNIANLRNATMWIDNQNFANGTMFSSVAVANLASSYFSLATIIEIDIPVTALSVKNSSGTTATFNLAFTIGLNYVEA